MTTISEQIKAAKQEVDRRKRNYPKYVEAGKITQLEASYQIEIMEQIGRFGCFISMFLVIPFLNKGFWFKSGKTIYIALGIGLVTLYCAGWIIFWKEDSIRKSLYLSIVPSLLFIESGVISGNFQLVVFAIIFAPCHILISYMNAILK